MYKKSEKHRINLNRKSNPEHFRAEAAIQKDERSRSKINQISCKKVIIKDIYFYKNEKTENSQYLAPP